MTDPVLTDEEKGALLEGISTGEVEVHSNKGPSYATVIPFEIGPRSIISTNSYPRLQSLNRQFAGRVSKQIEGLLNAETLVASSGVSRCTYSDACEKSAGLSLVIEFSAKPLPGPMLVLLDAATVAHLVETFFGGQGNESTHEEPEFFTPGEINVSKLFGTSALSLMAEIWAPFAGFSIEFVATHLSTGVIEQVDADDSVIVSDFSLEVADKEQSFQVILPVSTVGALLPVFEGQKRDRDAVNDAHWNRALRARVIDSIVRVSSDVGHTRMTLGEVAELEAGDVITISNPQNSTLLAGSVPILAGRFGVHDGRYAVEATTWLESKSDASVVKT